MERIDWKERTLVLPDGTEIAALHGRHPEGKGKPTLVLLHEALGCIRMWKLFPQQLSERLQQDVFVYERRGYGGSSPITLPRPDDYLEQEGRDWVEPVLDAAGLDKVTLIGHSDGGSVALVAAAQLSDRVVSIVTMAAHIYIDHMTTAGIVEACERYATTDLPQRLSRFHGERTDLLFRAWSETWQRPSVVENFNLTPWLSKIRCPALIMQGQSDQYGLPDQVDDICNGIGEHAVADFIANCAHIPHLEAADSTLLAIEQFLLRSHAVKAAS